MKKPPNWSVMIPVCNRTTHLDQTLESVLFQKKHTQEMEVVIVDNSTIKIEWDRVLKDKQLKDISIYKNESHLTIAENWNQCIKISKGEWIHILHDDDYVLPGFYTNFEKLALTHPNIDAAYCRYAYRNDKLNYSCMSELVSNITIIDEKFSNKICAWQQLQCPAVVVKKETYLKVGNFNNKYKYCLDWEMWIRIAANGNWGFVPQTGAIYRIHNESLTSNNNWRNQIQEIIETRESISKIFSQNVIDESREEFCNKLNDFIVSIFTKLNQSQKKNHHHINSSLKSKIIKHVFGLIQFIKNRS